MNNSRLLELTEVMHQANRLAALKGLIETWETRQRFRQDLERIRRTNPDLLDDIGLTGQEAETEITKHFWQG